MILDDIVAAADRRAAAIDGTEADLRRAAARAPAVRSLAAALSAPGLSVIAEVKRRSPSAGAIRDDLDPVGMARSYADAGADALSVLTEPDFFGGSLDDLRAVREAVDVPVLRKDFTRTAAQVWEARAAGADAILLIVAILEDAALRMLVDAADDVGVDAIVEVHTPAEVARAVAAGSRIIGVNNRDLTTFTTDLTVAEACAPLVPPGIVRVAESGMWVGADAHRMRAAGYDAILVGEALVRAEDPASLIDEFTGPP